MLFRKSELDEAGGLESVRDILAEDFILAVADARGGGFQAAVHGGCRLEQELPLFG